MKSWTSWAHFLGRSIVMAWPHLSSITTWACSTSLGMTLAPDGWHTYKGGGSGGTRWQESKGKAKGVQSCLMKIPDYLCTNPLTYKCVLIFSGKSRDLQNTRRTFQATCAHSSVVGGLTLSSLPHSTSVGMVTFLAISWILSADTILLECSKSCCTVCIIKR